MLWSLLSTATPPSCMSKTSTIPGYVAKLAEDIRKFKADEKSPEPVSSKHGGDHVVFVPFAME